VQLHFSQSDAFKVISQYLNQADAVFFVDPPYTQAARRLYTHWNIEHEELFKLLRDARGQVLMTYDDTKEVRRWANRYGFKVRKISMRTTHHQHKRELMISRDFGWLKVKQLPGSGAN
jgi:DNA adenine methylase